MGGGQEGRTLTVSVSQGGTQLSIPDTEAAGEEEEGGASTMGPKFRAAEQPFQTEFQIFSVSRGWGRCGPGTSPGRFLFFETGSR